MWGRCSCEGRRAPSAGGVALLAPLLRGAGAPAANQQVLYDAGLAAWQLTYYRPAAEIMGTTGARPAALVGHPLRPNWEQCQINLSVMW